jgi:hypothetical protein
VICRFWFAIATLDRSLTVPFLMASPRKPWPMKVIVALVILFIVPYTYLTLHYRKAVSVQPYQDVKERIREAQAGYEKRVTLQVSRPADGRTQSSPVAAAPGGLPAELRATFVVPPILPAEIGAVETAAAADGTQPYSIQFDCTLDQVTAQLTGAHLYLKGMQIVIVTDFETLPSGLAARSRSNVVRLTVPGGSLDPGTYQFTLAGARRSKAWTLQVH